MGGVIKFPSFYFYFILVHFLRSCYSYMFEERGISGIGDAVLHVLSGGRLGWRAYIILSLNTIVTRQSIYQYFIYYLPLTLKSVAAISAGSQKVRGRWPIRERVCGHQW